MMSIFRLIEKLLAFFLVFPPIYMLYRFIKWYLKQGREPQED